MEVGNEYMFGLFNNLVRILEPCKVVSDVEAKSGIEEFSIFVDDIRARHASNDQNAEEYPDEVTYLLEDYSFLARKNLRRVFKLWRLLL